MTICSVPALDVDLPVVTKRFLTPLTVTFSMWSLLCHAVLMEPRWIINAFQDSLLVSIRSLDFPGVAPIYCQVWGRCSCWQAQPAVVRRKENGFAWTSEDAVWQRKIVWIDACHAGVHLYGALCEIKQEFWTTGIWNLQMNHVNLCAR